MSAADLVFLAHRIPYPPDKGEKIRAYHILRHLAGRFRVHLGCFADDPDDLKHLARLRDLCASVRCFPIQKPFAKLRGLVGLVCGASLSEWYFSDARMRRWIVETVAEVDPKNIFLFSSSMVPYAEPFAAAHRVILDFVDVDSEKWQVYGEAAAWPLNQLYTCEARALLALERRAALAFDRSLFVSRAEAETFLRHVPEAAERVDHLDNGVDADYFDPSGAFTNPYPLNSQPIAFTGTMSYKPNIEAVQWFVHSILPRIRDAYPEAEFWIVGANPSASVRELARPPSVHVTGRVGDVRPYLAHARCVVVPLHIARGIQNKMLEAMAMAKPIVATPDACEGVTAVWGEELIVAKSAVEFAASVVSVLDGRGAKLGERARARVQADYNWSRNLAKLDALFPIDSGLSGSIATVEHPGPGQLGASTSVIS